MIFTKLQALVYDILPWRKVPASCARSVGLHVTTAWSAIVQRWGTRQQINIVFKVSTSRTVSSFAGCTTEDVYNRHWSIQSFLPSWHFRTPTPTPNTMACQDISDVLMDGAKFTSIKNSNAVEATVIGFFHIDTGDIEANNVTLACFDLPPTVWITAKQCNTI